MPRAGAGQINITTAGAYRFFLESDDGSRLFIDNQLVINNGGVHPMLEAASAPLTLDVGMHDIRVEYFENTGGAGVILRWDPPGLTAKEVVPASALFRDARGVIDVVSRNDAVLSGFNGVVSASAAGDVTPMIGSGLVGQFYQLGPLGNAQPDALSFDGNDRVQVTSSDSLKIERNLTLEARFKIDAFADTWMPLIQKGDGSFGGRSYVIWINQNGSIQLNVASTPTWVLGARRCFGGRPSICGCERPSGRRRAHSRSTPRASTASG